MDELVAIKNNVPVTTTLIIAEKSGIAHNSVIKLVRAYRADLEEFGLVRFEARFNTRSSPTEYAIVNEHQATLLLTLMGNNDIVIAFKKQLIKAFFGLASTYPLPDFTDPVVPTKAWAAKRKMDLAAAWRYKRVI
ncbi:MAG: Rha family transcriptional regulator [Candidatus Nitrosoglobus sp.]|jgi:phage regulator Rha-like protein